MRPRPWWALAVAVNAGAGIPWWIGLTASTEFRRLFLPSSHPDSALLAFALADAVFFIGFGLAAAAGLWRAQPWTRAMLLLHTGGSCYAALYTLQLFCMTGEAGIAAVAMSPSLVLLPWLCWRTRAHVD